MIERNDLMAIGTEIFHSSGNKCIDLDKLSMEGSEYKNDCRIELSKYLHLIYKSGKHVTG